MNDKNVTMKSSVTTFSYKVYHDFEILKAVRKFKWKYKKLGACKKYERRINAGIDVRVANYSGVTGASA